MLRFVFPTESSRQDVQLFYNEFQSDGGTCIGYGGYENFGHWLAGMNNRISGKNLPAGYVRENFYLCYDGDDMIGVFNLKFELTEFLLNFGGHIGSVAQKQWLRLADARAGARHRPRTRIRARAVCLRRGQLSLGARDNKKRWKIPLIKFVLIVYVINRQIAILQIITIHWYKTRILPQKTAAGFLPYKNPRTFRCGKNFI